MVTRPRYLKHDHDTIRDPKIIRMLSVYGNAGYGVWWRIVEFLWTLESGKATLSEVTSMAYAFHETKEFMEQFIQDCIERFDLFRTDGESFWSDRLCGDIDAWTKEGQKRHISGKVGQWKKTHQGEPIPQELQEACLGAGITVGVASRVPSSSPEGDLKVTSRKAGEKQNQKQMMYPQPPNDLGMDRFSKPTVDEVASYCKEQGISIDSKRQLVAHG